MELSFFRYAPLDREPEPSSVGVPLPSRQVRVVDPQSLETLPPGTPGELLVTSEYISKSYWKKPEETEQSYVEIDGKIWYRMNDFVKMDQNGQLYYVDRSADIIRDMLPKSKVGKLLRREIRDEERRRIGKEEPLKV
ncbi:MAG: AMP-binding protein [Thermodesulfobacteriota bacterium]